ncbi:hypothetical protein [Nocardioides sp.]|uniref:hypothetical protein n=1 Tax=Nocardioides sp. TaxID=35761 RepID=UPI001A3290F3|nr:hypothetical protein [Nocardioides sp.]MBJ7357591.1 hypothetical protein [Nocardioides sp.]
MTERVRSVLRMEAALAVAILVTVAVWRVSPLGLHPPVNIVGYPTFANFDFHPGFLMYRLAVWGIPAVTVVVLAVLWRWGPLAARRPSRRRAAVDEPVAAPDAPDAAAAGEHGGPAPSPARLAWVLPAAVAVVLAVSSRGAPVGGAVTGTGLVAGLVYSAGVLLLALALAVAGARRSESPLGQAWLASVSRVNGPASVVAAAAALCVFARSTATVSLSGQVREWAWVPVWAAAVLVCAAGLWGLWFAFARGSDVVLERRAVMIACGSVLVFMVTSALPGPIGQLQGFDDMQSVTGADLFTRGYFPWRDLTLIHGIFEDALRSLAGFVLFEHTLWGTGAAGAALWSPLGWVSLFLFAVWATRGRAVPLLFITALMLWVSHYSPMPMRWWFAPIVWILLGEALRRSRARWTALLLTALFVQAVLVPETAFQVLGVLPVLVGHDLVTRPAGTPWWRSLSKTRDAAVTGVVLIVLWAAFLAWHDSLRQFVDYYLIFGPGHVESGALPLGTYTNTRFDVAFIVAICLIVITLVAAGWIFLSKGAVSVRQWVMLGCALTAGLYGEKSLGRMDDGHVIQSVTVTIPLAMLWIAALLSRADVSLAQRWRRSRPERRTLAPLVSLVALVAVVVSLPAVREDTWHAPSSNKASVLDESLPLLGYSVPETYDEALLADLATVVDHYDGRDGGFFDFTNSLGFFYYLLQIDPITSYFHVSMAVPEFSQDDLVEQLEKDPPALVAIDALVGLPAWDGVGNQIRHFAVSQYLLDGWTPVLSTHGVIFMVRNDLYADRPPIPELVEEPRTTDLHFASHGCDWGFVPNYLESPATGRSVSVEVDPARRAHRIDVAGWAFDAEAGRLPTRILLVAGREVVATTPAGIDRPDVAAAVDPAAGKSGFALRTVTSNPDRVRVYAEYADGLAYPLSDRGVRIDSLVLPDGEGTIKVARQRGLGSVDESKVLAGWLSTVDVPEEVSLEDVRTLSLSRPEGLLGRGTYVLTDTPVATGAGDRTIRFETLFKGGDTISVRVGACLQWHGFDADQLYLFRRGGRDVREVTLSGLPG